MKFSYKCKSCGANVPIDTENIQAFCQFCGSSLPEAHELIKQTMEMSENEAERKHKLKMQRSKDQSSNHAITAIIIVSVLGFALIIAVIIVCMKAYLN